MVSIAFAEAGEKRVRAGMLRAQCGVVRQGGFDVSAFMAPRTRFSTLAPDCRTSLTYLRSRIRLVAETRAVS